jgi:hypothetical protein
MVDMNHISDAATNLKILKEKKNADGSSPSQNQSLIYLGLDFFFF